MNLPDYATVSSWRRTHRVRAITPNGGRLAVVSSPTRGPRLLARHGARAARCCRNGAVMPRGRAGDAESSMAPERAAALATVQLTGDSRANWTLDGRSGARRVAVELPALRSEPLLRRRMVEPARPSARAGARELCAVVREAADYRPELLPSLVVGQTVVLVEPLPGAVDEQRLAEPRPHPQVAEHRHPGGLGVPRSGVPTGADERDGQVAEDVRYVARRARRPVDRVLQETRDSPVVLRRCDQQAIRRSQRILQLNDGGRHAVALLDVLVV